MWTTAVPTGVRPGVADFDAWRRRPRRDAQSASASGAPLDTSVPDQWNEDPAQGPRRGRHQCRVPGARATACAGPERRFMWQTEAVARPDQLPNLLRRQRRWLGTAVRSLTAAGWCVEHVITAEATSGVTLVRVSGQRLLLWSVGAIDWQESAPTRRVHPEFADDLTANPIPTSCAMSALVQREWQPGPPPAYRGLKASGALVETMVDVVTHRVAHEMVCACCGTRFVVQQRRDCHWRFIPRHATSVEHCRLRSGPSAIEAPARGRLGREGPPVGAFVSASPADRRVPALPLRQEAPRYREN